MRFAIRDDDTSYFTRPEDLERAYHAIWESHPVSLGVVPFQGCTRSGALPEVFWSGCETFPLHQNPSLVAFLRDGIRRGRLSILMHGFDHVDRDGHPEFASTLGSDELARRLHEGRRYLEELLETSVGVFVPPHNAMSREALAAVERHPVDLLGTFSFRPGLRQPTSSNMGSMVRRRLFIWKQRRRGWGGRFYPYPLQVDGHQEMACHDLNRDPACSLDRLVARLEQTFEVGGDFCLATHYWEVCDEPLSTWLRGILERAEGAGAQFVHAGDLFSQGTACARRGAAA